MSLKKIAEMTGASVSTVGRILNDPEHRTSEELRRRVLQAAREIGYVPNEAARRLKTGNVQQKEIYHVDILITSGHAEQYDPFFHEVQQLLETELRNKGCIVSAVWYRPEFSDEKYCMKENISKQIAGMYEEREQQSEGLIIIGKCTAKAIKALKGHTKSIVSINRNSTNYAVDEVICDGEKTALTAIGYLVQCGHSKIGYVGDCHNEARFTGYQAAQMRFHLASNIDYIFDTQPNEDHGYRAMEYFLKMDDPPTGIYCANDILAIGMLKCLAKRRSRYYTPSIISNDDIEAAQYSTPMLTTVALPKREMVRFAVFLLLDRIHSGHKVVAKLELEGTLVIRGSCHSVSAAQEPEYFI